MQPKKTNRRTTAYAVETSDGHKIYQISSLKPDEFASSFDAYADTTVKRVLVLVKGGWKILKKPPQDDIA